SLRQFIGAAPRAHYRNVTYVQSSVFVESKKDQAITHQEDVVDQQRQDYNRAVRACRLNEGQDCSGHEPGKTYRLGKAADLLRDWTGEVGIDPKGGKQESPRRKDNRKNPEVYPKLHKRMPVHLYQVSDVIRDKKACRSKQQIENPQIYGKNFLPLVNHM